MSTGERAGLGWWSLRVAMARDVRLAREVRAWAVAEVACAAVTIATCLAIVALPIVARFVPLPEWVFGWPSELMLAAAVGYGTNFLAVQMLFKPRDPFTRAPMRWIWRQGLIPAKQAEMAQIVGEEVAAKLLTPEAVVEELVRIVELALEDRATIERVQQSLLPVLERELPALVQRFLPETLVALRKALEDGVSAEDLRKLLLDVLDGWFAKEQNRAALAGFALELVRARSSELTKLMKRALKRYGKTSSIRSLAIGAGVATNIVDWDDFEQALRDQLKTEKARIWAGKLVDSFAVQIRLFAERVIRTEWLVDLKRRAGDVALESAERNAERALVEKLVVLLGSPKFRAFVLEELVPKIRPKIVAWLAEGHLTPVLERFDVRGRVAKAAAALDVAELEDMANRVGAYHLAAIQVLGWVLGLAAGALALALRAAH
ncbi:DUF445 family protein [Myxococcota bacterium]|nr:DUF445 family protein [Myxococcota bacterium]